MRLDMNPQDTAPLLISNNSRDLAISTDGKQVVYNGPGPQLYLRTIDQASWVPVPGGEGAAPFFSPDGEWIGFYDTTATILQKVSILGGPPVRLTQFTRIIRGATWGTDDQIIFGTSDAGLFRVSGGGGEPEALTTLGTEQGDVTHRWPSNIPDREAVVFVIGTGEVDSGQLAVLDLDTGEVTRLGLAGVSPHYVATGHLVYATGDGSLRAVPFDARSLEVTGNAVPLVGGVVVKASGAADFSVSDTGHLVYVPGVGGGPLNLTSRLVATGKDGVGTPMADIAGYAWYPRFSPDGTRVAFAVSQTPGGGGDADLWVLDIARGTRTRLTSEGNNRFYPVWSPDGSQLAFADGAGATNRVLVTSADGSGEPETLLDRDERQFPTSWVAHGNVMTLYIDNAGTTARDLSILPMDGDLTPEPFLATPFQERGVSFSPDGRWVAYVSDESGQDEVYVRPYPGPGGQVIISTGGGGEVVWGPDGSELFYRSGEQVMVVPVDTRQAFSAEAPSPLFAAAYALDTVGVGGNPNYDISPDGERFIFVEQDSPIGVEEIPRINVVLNWFEELKARVPVP